MKTVKIKLSRKVVYESQIIVSDKDFEIIKNLDNDEVEMYDPKSVKTYESGTRTIQQNPQYSILENLDAQQYEIDREETLFDVTVEEL